MSRGGAAARVADEESAARDATEGEHQTQETVEFNEQQADDTSEGRAERQLVSAAARVADEDSAARDATEGEHQTQETDEDGEGKDEADAEKDAVRAEPRDVPLPRTTSW
ncbi:unnamed protein product [Vitrella brassicaformis CCMP3155]|uniref:Uncharacterized protein n=1 Tax=Vitrella brassicaformis (strain CCMP3155) TaxID=1169540 RepID=A0A0G4EDT6_VITBC|nr:unnamed protein product [Vitrella brassicaformis CCMP3155]|eukprot:CEL93538.1 unnamed protein product [Vitrella brassicaformis CCMP3155]